MCECLTYDDGSMHLCLVDADLYREMVKAGGYTLISHVEGKRCADMRCSICANRKMTHWSEVFRIVTGALAGDADKVKAYALFLADKIEADNDPSTAERLRKIADGQGGAVVRTANVVPIEPNQPHVRVSGKDGNEYVYSIPEVQRFVDGEAALPAPLIRRMVEEWLDERTKYRPFRRPPDVTPASAGEEGR